MIWLEWCQRLALHGGDMFALDMEYELGYQTAFALFHSDDVWLDIWLGPGYPLSLVGRASNRGVGRWCSRVVEFWRGAEQRAM